MIPTYGFEIPVNCRNGVVSIGNFDGVHRGHQQLLATLVKRARQGCVPAVVLTFDPHPLELLRPGNAPPRLTTLARRTELLHEFGVDCVIVLATTSELLKMTADDFFHTIVRSHIHATGLVEGPNFCFGRNREGDISRLQRLCSRHQMSLDIVPQFAINERRVSSSLIRNLIDDGDLVTVVRLLGHPHRISGVVESHDESGNWGPSLNLINLANLIPRDGVYAGTVIVGNRHVAATIEVPRDSDERDAPKTVVVHLSDDVGKLRGEKLEIELLCRSSEFQGDSLQRFLVSR